MIANYENLVVSSGKDISTIGELISEYFTDKETHLNKLLLETDFKDLLRSKYRAEEERQAEERKALSDLVGFVNFEVGKFGISNKLIYFRQIENLEEVRRELAAE